MGIRMLGLTLVGVLATSPAFAGNGSGYSAEMDNGVVVYRGQHGPLITDHERKLLKQEERQDMKARKAAELGLLNAKLDAQTNQLAALHDHMISLEEAHRAKPRRRKVYYGNPAFFGRNGFIGNRYHGGATMLGEGPRYRRRGKRY